MVYNYGISDDDSGIVFRDVITLALIGIFATVVILLTHVNPPGSKKDDDIVPPGNIIIELSWDNNLSDDVDLWVKAPGDVAVGYSNKGGTVFNLLRDDLGSNNDISQVNFETAFSRGILPGEYIVNVHLYRNSSATLPIKAVVSAKLKRDANANTENLVSRVVELTKQGQELTVFRFKISPAGKFLPESLNTLQIPLRSS